MGIFDGFGSGGLMGAMANPQTAGMLGLAQGLLAASGPSRLPISMGQALGSGLQGMQQNMGNALQMQRTMMALNALNGTMPGAQQGQQAPNAQSLPPVTGNANVAGLSGPSAGMGSFAPPTPVSLQSAAQQTQTPFEAQFGMTPEQMFQRGNAYAMLGLPNGAPMMELAAKYNPSLAYAMPTPQMQNVAAATGGPGTPGFTQGMQGILAKDTTVSLRPGAPFVMNGKIMTTPAAAPPGFMNSYDNASGQWSVGPIQGGPQAVQSSSAAQAGGKATFDLAPVWQQDPQTGKWVQVNQTRLNVANAANGTPIAAGAATPASAAIVQTESGGNPNAVSPKGAQGAWQVMPNTKANPGFGVTPAQNNSRAELDRVGRDYYNAMVNRYGNNPTIGAIAYNMGPGATDAWLKNGANWEALPQETRNYVGKVSTLTALNGGGNASPSNSPAAPRNGPMLAAPPLGTTNATDTSQGAPSEQMKTSYGDLSNADENYQQSRADIVQMLALAKNKGALGAAVGVLPDSISTRLSPDAAEYQKFHADYVSQQGKTLGGKANTDAARATINESVPGYDKPQSAMMAGLTNQLNRLDLMHLKTQFLTPTYQSGDEKTYTALNAGFDQNIQPEMMPVLHMSGASQRAAVQAAVKANPLLRANYEWAFNHGLLK